MVANNMEQAVPMEEMPETSKAAKVLKLILILALAGGLIYFVGATFAQYFDDFKTYVAGLGAWGPVVFIAAYALGAILWVPGAALTLLAGAIFGVLQGTGFVFIASTTAAIVSFLIARHLMRGVMERKIAGNARFSAIDQAIGQQGFKIAFLLRLSPVFPFVLLNYALGLTKIRLRDFALASFGTLPGTLLYVYLGSAAGDAVLASGGMPTADMESTSKWILKGVGLLATLVVTVIITRIARKALKESANVGN
ncbi:MAG: TVP38/TMEM64 family protein [Planctomycetes bacterium]|nr:TVP38/TMEM64 family protein [Planctomycetota bacterium]